jgi:hypothetical protein
MTSPLDCLRLIEVLIGVALILQTIELLMIRSSFSEQGIWRWSHVKKEFPSLLRIDLLFGEHGFLLIVCLRLLAAIFLLVNTPWAHWIFSAVLTLSTLLISVRWLGTFNGGSDYMTFLILYSITIGRFFENNERILKGAIFYIAIQTCLSYFVAGVVKLKSGEWRSGRALAEFFNASYYEVPERAKKLPFGLLVILSWVLIIFECGFPLALHNLTGCYFFIGAAVLFHLGAFYLFGLNRFLFAWLAAYPALTYLAAR